ncbi:MAG: SHOCT domain-containing protein [Candidatus Altimarinota bacterium]
MHQMFWNGMGGWMFLWWIFVVLIVVGVATFVFRQGRSGENKSALDILKERYAKGEITKQEFEEKKLDIL